MARPTHAAKFWGGLALYILCADTWLWRVQQNTMSDQWSSWLQNPRGRRVCIAVWGTLTAHLFFGLPLPGQKKLKTAVINVGAKRKVIIIEEE